MSYDGVKAALSGLRERRWTRLSPAAVLVLVFAFATVIGVTLLTIPRPVAPTGMPALRVEPTDAARVRARDLRLAARAPHDAAANDLRDRYRAYCSAERAGGQQPADARQTIGLMALAARRYREAHGDDAVAALRAEATVQAERALRGELPETASAAVLGTFDTMLERYGAADAPPFVMRTLFVSRWNVAHGYPATLGMRDEELRAYWGWLALAAEHAPIPRRLDALEAYARAGGSRAAEARGTLLFREGQMLQAAEAFQQAFEEEGSLRLRNYSLAAMAIAAAGAP